MKRWEAICRRCGRCCYEKSRTPAGIIVCWDQPCEFLDTATALCRVYPDRFRRCPQCRKLTPFHALFSPYLPEDCGYVRAFRRWRRSSRSRPAG